MSKTNGIDTSDEARENSPLVRVSWSKKARDEAFSEALRIIEKHRISGYFCSCGAEINSQEAHHSQMIRIAKDS